MMIKYNAKLFLDFDFFWYILSLTGHNVEAKYIRFNEQRNV